MKKKKNFLALLLAALMLLSLLSACGEKEPEEETVETEEVVLLEAEGALVSFEEGVLTLAVDGGEQSFSVAANTTFSLARGFIAGDTFTVSYEEDNADAALSVASAENSGLKPYTLRGTVKSLGEYELRVALDDGGTADFALSGAALDLWQGLREGIYVELTCLGEDEGGSCVWLQSVTDNDGAALLTQPTPEPTEETTTETVETTEETVEYAWPYEACDDTVWASVRANLRTGPGMEYPCVGDVDCGEELSRRGLSGDWSAVMIDGREYYISSELLLTERPGKLSTITYDANGGMAAPEAQHKLGGEAIQLSLLEPVRGGWQFVSWNTNEKGFGVTFFAGDEYEMDGDATLYAQWVEVEEETATEAESTATGEPSGEQTTAETAEMTEEATTEESVEAAPVRDTSSAIAGTLVSMRDGKLTLEAAGLEYVFDIASATLMAERGVHPGDSVTLYYAGTLDADRGSAAAPAVRVQIAAGDGCVTGEVTAVGQGFVALSLGKTELFAAVDGLDAEPGDEITLTLAPSAAQSNLFDAEAK